MQIFYTNRHNGGYRTGAGAGAEASARTVTT